MSESELPSDSAAKWSLRRLSSDRFSGVLLLLLALYVTWENRAYPIGTLQEPGPGYVPLLLAILLGVLGLMIAIWGGRSEALLAIRWPEATRALVILLACGVGAFALERIGYRLTVIALLIFFLGVVERRRPWMVVLVSIGFGFISYYVVGNLLHVPLPRSPWGL